MKIDTDHTKWFVALPEPQKLQFIVVFSKELTLLSRYARTTLTDEMLTKTLVETLEHQGRLMDYMMGKLSGAPTYSDDTIVEYIGFFFDKISGAVPVDFCWESARAHVARMQDNR
jgi:hypothetical protein